ncbi:xanthine dehydrogenase family protein molybdopterin-binding subunit [Streptomyces sp. NPDC001315]|uniref:xanthine dehydrogenase family protein molybdopterin-binding subunit n=1 Tax=Streptomyces sp. NPDC001315 TaxID=3364562 RepID=UPI0036B9B1D6
MTGRPLTDGTVVPSVDHLDRVTGAAVYAADVPCPGALHAALVRSTQAHARVVSADTSEAEKLPGVHTVLTGASTGARRFGRFTADYPVLAVDRVLFAGQPIAAVAATDRRTALRAAALVNVTYEPLPAVTDPAEAPAEGAVVLHPGYDGYTNPVPGRPAPNVQGSGSLNSGDASAALGECDLVVTHTYTWDRSHSAPLEPHTCLVDATGPLVHVWAAHKEPFKLRRDLAAIGGRDESTIVIHPVKIGGDFGAKGSPFVEGPCLLLSEATGRPVRAALPFAEELAATGARHGGSVELRAGLRDGRLHVHQGRITLDGGAFAALKPMPTGVLPLLGFAVGAYDVPHVDETTLGVYTNNVPGGHVRSPGEFQLAFAAESHIDELAAELGVDPLEFRREHAAHAGMAGIVDRLARASASWETGERDGLLLGVGHSVFHRGPGPGESTVRLRATAGGVLLDVGVPDQGAGSYELFRRIVSDRLGVPVDQVVVTGAGTDAGLTDAGAGASRVTVVVGRATAAACGELLAALEVARPPDDPGWLGHLTAARGEVTVSATAGVSRQEFRTLRAGLGGLAVQAAVDPDTGVTRVLRAHLVADIGPVLNPPAVRGQLEGGFVFGLSQTLYERLITDGDGAIVTTGLDSYKLAGHCDVPPLEIELVESADDPRDFSAITAVGELANLGVPGAVANAVARATGGRVRHLPLTAERVLAAVTATRDSAQTAS